MADSNNVIYDSRCTVYDTAAGVGTKNIRKSNIIDFHGSHWPISER
jgi:hypothetical protein